MAAGRSVGTTCWRPSGGSWPRSDTDEPRRPERLMAGAGARVADPGAKAGPARGPSGRGGTGLVPPASGVEVVDQSRVARAAPLTPRVPVGGADDPIEREA